MKVGYQGHEYPVRRNIIGLVSEIEYTRIYDAYELFRKLNSVSMRLGIPFDLHDSRFKFSNLFVGKVDVIHLFNSVSFSSVPWVSTFETIIPRYQVALSCHHGSEPSFSGLLSNRDVNLALESLSQDSCKKIIAISECTADIQREMLANFPNYQSQIEKKMVVMHPPQEAYFHSYDEKRLVDDGSISFLFAGAAFFRKGGLPMLRAFRQLKEEDYNLNLSIVSDLTIDDYAARETAEDLREAEEIISQNGDWITHYGALPNEAVLDLMKNAHVGLLPTYADTYGYSVLELQGCGCPVITTDVRALTEINDNSVGWLIEIPKNRLKEAVYTSGVDRSVIAHRIERGIVQIVRSIFTNRTEIKMKANRALARIRRAHNPARYAEKLHEIYRVAANSSL